MDPGGSPPDFGAVLEIDNSQNVTVQGLLIGVTSRTIADAIPGILVQSSDVRIVQDRIDGAGASDGIDMFQVTVRLIAATIIENNNDGQGNGSGVGLFGPGSQLLLLNDFSGNCPVLQGNDTGIFAGRGGTVVRAPFGRGCVTIQNNAFAAVIANLGATIDLNVPQANPGSVKLVSNLFGLYAQNGSHFILSGPVLIQGNSIDGIRLRTASVPFCLRMAPPARRFRVMVQTCIPLAARHRRASPWRITVHWTYRPALWRITVPRVFLSKIIPVCVSSARSQSLEIPLGCKSPTFPPPRSSWRPVFRATAEWTSPAARSR